MVDILLGLLEPKEGKILINGIEKDYFNYVVKKIGYIPQDHLIISDTIISNITLETNKKLINKDKLNNAIHSANLSQMIDSLPGGVNTLIGKDGIRLSEDNIKNALARLFYHDKEILIMDEATNSLDKHSEEVIVNELNRLKKDKTIIVISHSEKTLRACDKILKIHNKSIVPK